MVSRIIFRAIKSVRRKRFNYIVTSFDGQCIVIYINVLSSLVILEPVGELPATLT